jgi:beta-glucosidase
MTDPGASLTYTEAAARVRAGDDPAAVANEFVAGLTLDEKLWCLDGDEEFWPGLIRLAGGASARVAGEGYGRSPWRGAEVPRVGFPGIAFSDGPRGVVVGPNTCFPVAMARGATFDPELEERVGKAIGLELRARGATLFGGVNVNLLRHPAWGRAQETYGEDPHHVGEMGAALTRGVQRHAMACVKHFALNSIDNARFKVDVRADERALHEVYLPHFKRVVDEGVACVMSAYNSVNGEWCGQNRTLLTEILREEWGFEGFVISDWIFGLRDPVKSVLAGLDIEMPFRQQRMQHVPQAVAEGVLTESDIEAPVRRTVATLLRFDDQLSHPAPDATVAASSAHRELAYQAAAKSIVLLKSDRDGAPLLPLEADTLRRVAVIGRLAAVPNLGDRGSSNVVPPSVITPLEGLRAALAGIEVLSSDGDDVGEAQRTAKNADVAIVVVGCTYEDEGEYISAQPELLMATAPPRPPRPDAGQRADEPRPAPQRREQQQGFATAGDRASLDLSERDQALIRGVAAANASTVVVLMGGSAIMVEGWHDRVPAILMLWYPGMEGGRALADVLLGTVNPSGRLPFVVPRDASHLPPFDRDATTATYDLFHGQWLLDHNGDEARYPFGHGLSYANATIRDARVSLAEGTITVDCILANDDAREASEVVQVYAGHRSAGVERPEWRLYAFQRVGVAARGTSGVKLTIPVERLAVRTQGRWTVEQGEYEIAVGLRAHDPQAHKARINVH